MPHELPKSYEPGAIEKRWAEYWIEEKLFSVPTPPRGAGDGLADKSVRATRFLVLTHCSGFRFFRFIEFADFAVWCLCGALLRWTAEGGCPHMVVVEASSFDCFVIWPERSPTS